MTGVKAFLATVAAGIIWFLGGWDKGVEILVIFVALDYVTGLMAAFSEKKLNSNVGLRGILKKVAMFLLVGFAAAVDHYVGGGLVRSATIGFLLANEGLSILENFGRLGIPIPDVLSQSMEKLKSPDAGKPPEGGGKA